MNRIEHLLEPGRLLLVWQRPSSSGRRDRRVVAEIQGPSSDAVFRYLNGTADFELARSEGFQGYPAFKLQQLEHHAGVVDAFLRRLPPRKRDDFGEYLQAHRLPDPFVGTDMALLAYTGARLPSDGFEVIPDLANSVPPFELVVETAGLRHQDGVKIEQLQVGDPVSLAAEANNPVDPRAIAVVHGIGRIGYLPRPYCDAVGTWLTNFCVDAVIERINGKPERPLVYLFLRVRRRS